MCRRTTTTVVLSTLPLVVLASFFIAGATTPPPQTKHDLVDVVHHHPREVQEAALSFCKHTIYPSLCVSIVRRISNLTSDTPMPGVISNHVGYVKGKVRNLASVYADVVPRVDPRQHVAVTDCLELFDKTLDELDKAGGDLSRLDSGGKFHNIQTRLSAAMTNQDTCLGGFDTASNCSVRDATKDSVDHISQVLSNALAMTATLPQNPGNRKNEANAAPDKSGFPEWLSKRDRRLLQAPVIDMSVDLVVAKDGTGDFKTIGEAVAAAPVMSRKRYVIYIKCGVYSENVVVGKKKWNLVFVGDGMSKTIVTANRNVVDGWTTFRSATFAVSGEGFIARGMTFENTAGPSKHQAVAFRSSADLSALYRCGFVGYQDTLYVHSLRQFYRECKVFGTVDFIFGNAAVVLQACHLYARRPNPKQKNTFTAQGRSDPNQNTGISIQKCILAAAGDLFPVQSSFKTYLGRPWREYSRTVILNSYLGYLIDPAGWLEWSGDFALSTLYYREFLNIGLGSDTSRRVDWPGYRVTINPLEAALFTPGWFLLGDRWLPETGVPYTSGLL